MATRLVVFFFLVLLLAGCRATAIVNVEVDEDGSGIIAVEVELDQEAAAGLLDLEGSVGLWLADIADAGWVIVPPEVGADGLTRVGALKEFGNPEQFTVVMAELSGSAELFSDFELSRSKQFARVRYELSGVIHPSGIEGFGDAELVDSLGRSIEDIAASYGGGPSDVNVELKVSLPGHFDDSVDSNGTTSMETGGVSRRWELNLAEDADVSVLVGSTTTGVAALVWRGISVLAGVLALLVGFGHLLRVLRPAGRKGLAGKSKGTRPSARGPVSRVLSKPEKSTGRVAGRRRTDPGTDDDPDVKDGSGSSVPDDGSGGAGPAVVALDGMGVLYREGSDVAEILLPFAREMGSTVSDESITSKVRAMSLGRLAPVDFWKSIGVEGDTNELDDLYLARHQLNPGVVAFLRQLRERGIKVACITNDSASWANKLNARHSLEGLIDPWVVSGAVGVRKPDAPLFEVLRRVTGEPVESILIVDDELDNLDAARDLGFRTAWFAPAGDSAGARGHAILRSFSISEVELPR